MPPVLPHTLEVAIMLPRREGAITLAACFIPRKTPTKLTLITSWKSDILLCIMLGFHTPMIPALLCMMSSFPNLETAVSTARSM
ncbi:hypothetical protein VIGAN_06159400 [Vigna angularis var. angularis]|uniref:Uncharacterized protein n=1 Tax=Vigna angularis var. angularis TaxID=157739 RepID=A0A0S3SC34_PHAAN|nr:hypothetical protein VIGAN_06159400 [Vigna angularis var. angularis]